MILHSGQGKNYFQFSSLLGEAHHRKYKQLEVGGSQAYDQSIV